MYHHLHHLPSERTTLASNSGLVLSTDAKPRLKWTPELHEHFVEAVDKLGGPEKATPKTLMRLMGIPGLTLYHLKSHLQKYRLSKNIHVQATGATEKNGFTTAEERTSESSRPVVSFINGDSHSNKNVQISETLQVQIEVQKRLNEQLEVQRRLQMRIEAQGKYLQSVLEKAQQTLGRKNLCSVGIEAAKVHISELVSKVSKECFPVFSDIPVLQFADYSMDSCLTTCEGSQKEPNTDMILGNYHDMNDYRVSSQMRMKDLNSISNPNELKTCLLEEEGERGGNRRAPMQLNSPKNSMDYKPPFAAGELDLNVENENNDSVSNCKEFDLNDFCWS
ncbi:Myb family transcription factor APL [Apostasia shenzhenica]|uniref:Myb family transcription factor APL n=1 Tax=Apostasia shenzhenica TaxID=1088818 RepID=A0A2I0ASK1_9ASPA|nr:Myb family transcription factor APL [Apostasia shenzhenica]